MTYKKITYLLLLPVILLGCIKEPENNQDDLINSFDREAMLENLCDNYIVPGYNAYYSAILALEQDLTTFEMNTSSANFIELKNSFYEGCMVWQGVAFLNFGPAENIVLVDQTNIFPIDTALIHTNIDSGNYNLTLSSNFTAKGWQSLDYLLHSSTDTTLSLNYLVNNPNAIQYCKDVVADLKLNASYVKTSWSSYAATFKDNSLNNASGSAVSDLINKTVGYYEMYVRKGKVGIPVGVFNGFTQQPMPENTEGYYTGVQLQYATATMEYFQKFLNGTSFDGTTDGLGLLDYANYVEATAESKSLSEAINIQFEKILLANELCITPWSDFVMSNPPTSNDIYLEYQKLIPLLKVDLSSALGVIIVYQDNDGD